ncbi:MAG: hypothetical protein ACI9XB_004906 [Gammaproteobacteria bacterium]
MYDDQFPMVEHSPKGWAILKDIRAEEFMAGFDKQSLSQQRPYNLEYLKDRNREMVTVLIETVGDSGEKSTSLFWRTGRKLIMLKGGSY